MMIQPRMWVMYTWATADVHLGFESPSSLAPVVEDASSEDDDDGDDDDEDKVSVMWDGGREVDDAATNHKNYVKQQTTTIPIQHTAL